MPPNSSIPSFAIVGQPNDGKTTILATLAENDRAKIDPSPGTTWKTEEYPVKVDGETILVFYDTPGFEHPAEVLEWFQNTERSNESRVDAFLKTFENSGKFRQECEILEPLSKGAVAIYIADTSRSFHEVDKQNIEILRLTGVGRVAVINAKEDGTEYRQSWMSRLREDFNLVREFNGHTANFRDRIALLEFIKTVSQNSKSMEEAIQVIQNEWDSRLKKVADLIAKELKDLMELKENEVIQNPKDKERAANVAKERLMNAVRKKERHFRKAIRELFKHNEDHWEIPTELKEDILSEQVWKLLGLTKIQIAVTGAVTGAIVGGVIDAHMLGASWGIGAVLGFVGGGGGAILSGKKAVHLNLPRMKYGPFSLPMGGKMGGESVDASVDRKNLPWIIIDRYLLYVGLCMDRAHGKREEILSQIDAEESKKGFTANWPDTSRKKMWNFINCVRENANQEKQEAIGSEVRKFLLSELQNFSVRERS